MLCHSRACNWILLLCVFSLWSQSALCGSSFLSPTQKPQGRGDRKPLHVGRRAAIEIEPPLAAEDKIMVSAPFQLGVYLNEAEYEDYGPVLQRMLLEFSGDITALE